jgi:hypothetical protein
MLLTWSGDHGEFVGAVAEFPSPSWPAETQAEALDGVVRDVLEDVAVTGEQPPVPIADRPYSGKFMVHTSP